MALSHGLYVIQDPRDPVDDRGWGAGYRNLQSIWEMVAVDGETPTLSHIMAWVGVEWNEHKPSMWLRPHQCAAMLPSTRLWRYGGPLGEEEEEQYRQVDAMGAAQVMASMKIGMLWDGATSFLVMPQRLQQGPVQPPQQLFDPRSGGFRRLNVLHMNWLLLTIH